MVCLQSELPVAASFPGAHTGKDLGFFSRPPQVKRNADESAQQLDNCGIFLLCWAEWCGTIEKRNTQNSRERKCYAMKRKLSLILFFAVLFTCVAPEKAAATGAIDSIDSIIIDMYNDSESAPQQTSAVAFGSMYMLSSIVNSTCSRSRREAVSDIVKSITDSVGSVDGAPQVSALSLYGCVYELCAIAYEKDRLGAFNELITSVIDDLTNADTNSAVQEMAAASYRMVDILSIIAIEDGCSSELVLDINDTLAQNNANLSGAPQQTANGLYRSAELIYLISKQDCSSYTANRIYDLFNNMYEDNDKCQSAVQQTSNGMVTIYLMLRTIAYEKA